MIDMYIIYYVCFENEANHLRSSMDCNALYEKTQISCTNYCDCLRDPAYGSTICNVSKRARKELREAPTVWTES